MVAARIIGTKELDAALRHPGSESSWSYPAAVPSKKAIKNMEKRSASAQTK